jgi:hypothetical protein
LFASFAATSISIPTSVTSIGNYAFPFCTGLTNVTIPNSVTAIGAYAFQDCTSLIRAYFQGNAPRVGANAFHVTIHAIVYYLLGTTGWSTTFAERPTAPWLLAYPVILTTAPNFGVQTNNFGFVISWATNAPVVVEACTTLSNPSWSAVSTNTLTDDWSNFSDARWTNYPNRFYRVRTQ